MRPLIFTLAALLGFDCALWAALASNNRPDMHSPAEQLHAVQARLQPQPNRQISTLRPRSTPAQQSPLNLTKDSLVILDGRSCRYEEVPSTAVVTHIELADDEQTILRIHFRTR